MNKLFAWIVLGSACLGLSGCASMLPRGSSVMTSPFASYGAAKEALDKAVPYTTTREELKSLGFDPDASTNVTVIPYPEVITRLAPHPGVPLDALDRGVRDCILAQTQCSAYVFHFGEQSKHRLGSFWLDFFNIDRTTELKGWRFEGLVVVRDGVVLFKNVGGDPRIDAVERQVNPLGPFQSGGESAGSWVRR